VDLDEDFLFLRDRAINVSDPQDLRWSVAVKDHCSHCHLAFFLGLTHGLKVLIGWDDVPKKHATISGAVHRSLFGQPWIPDDPNSS
jgi:hypothetical protein